MAAYAALLSLANVLDDILHPDDPNRLPFHKQQVESLREKLSFLLESLENGAQDWGGGALSPLEMKIRDAAYEAEDTIKSLILDHFHSKSQSHGGGDLSVDHHDLEKIIEEINSIQKEVTEMIESREDRIDFLERSMSNTPMIISSSRQSNSQFCENNMVGFDDEFLKMKERILSDSQQKSSLQIIPIVGVGGAGKTTFATRVYNDQEIREHFDVLALTKLTQNYQVGEIVKDLLRQIKNQTPVIQEASDGELLEHLYQRLKEKRYLIVMDDIWSKEAWDDFSRCFQDDYTGSRILLTTRLTNVADYVNLCRTDHHQMRPLESDESWKLFQEKVFGKDYCPPELEDIGKDIAEKCQGFPLAIVTISGLLSKADKRREIWEDIAEKISSIRHTDEQFSDILKLTYISLPHNLKVCFLYMGILLLQNKEIQVSRLFKLWEAEGFLKPARSKTLKTIAEDYLRDLVERNLVSVIRKGSSGEMSSCGIHDLLRDLCVKIGQMENVLRIHNKRHSHDGLPSGKDMTRRLIITSKNHNDDGDPFNLTEQVKKCLSHVWFLMFASRSFRNFELSRYYSCFKLIRVFDASQITFESFPEEVLELVNLRYLDLCTNSRQIPSSICRLWALKTLILGKFKSSIFCFGSHTRVTNHFLPREIWGMTRLKHIHVNKGMLPVPKDITKNGLVQGTSLETISALINFMLTEEVVEKLANLKKLKLHYEDSVKCSDLAMSYLPNLLQIGNLETLGISYSSYHGNWRGLKPNVVGRLAFPKTLTKLTLCGCKIPWEYMTIIGSLPVLQVLKLEEYAFQGKVWETTEGQFCELKFLLLSLLDLEEWRAESSNFPNLECLIVTFCLDLRRIPKGIGDIPTLKMMKLDICNSSAATSVEEIRNDLQELGIDSLQINISNVLPNFK